MIDSFLGAQYTFIPATGAVAPEGVASSNSDFEDEEDQLKDSEQGEKFGFQSRHFVC